MNKISKEIYVTQKRLEVYIDVTCGTDLVPIALNVIDYEIPKEATATVYSIGKENKLKKQICTISENEILFTPQKGYFEVGSNLLQVRLTYQNKDLISFEIMVIGHKSIVSDDAEEVKNNQGLMQQLLSEMGVLSARLNEALKIPEGGTTADVALNDIKVGYDGTVHDSPGDAVRAQVGELKSDLINLPLNKTGFFETGSNKFNGKLHHGMLQLDGTEIYTTERFTSDDFIIVKPGEVLQMCTKLSRSKVYFFAICCYTADNILIQSTNDVTNSFVVPDGIYKIKFSVAELKDYFVYDASNAGNQLLPYQEYKESILKGKLPELEFDMFSSKPFERRKLPNEAFEETERSINLLDLSKCEYGILEKGTCGEPYYNINFKISDYVYLEGGKKYCITSNLRSGIITIFDTNFIFVEEKALSLITTPNIHTEFTPDTDCFVRICCVNRDMDTAMIVEGDSYPSEYVPYFCKIKKSAIYGMSDDSIDFYLPDTIYVASGRTIDLYYKQFFLQSDRYHIRCICDIGIPYENRFTITCNDAMTGNTYPLTVSVYNDNLEVVLSKTVNIKVVSNAISSMNILPIGDSLTQKPWLPEIQNLSNGNISFIGQHNYSINDADGNVRTGGCQGVPGWTAGNYLTTNSPFYNSGDGTYSLSNYCNEYLDGQTPDAIIVWLGTNALQLDPTGNATEIKNVVDMLRNDGNTIPVFVLNTIYKSTQDAIGRQSNVEGYKSANGGMKYMEDKKVFNLMNELSGYFKDYENVQIVPCAITMDAVNGFGAIEVNVNSRCTRKKLIPSDSVHPQPDGYYQIADTVFSAICGHYNGN